jgi:Holliday junction resolvase
MSLERDLERVVCRYAERAGWFEAKIASSNKRGMPDRVFHRKGETMYVEFKRPGNGCTAIQLKRHEDLRKAGIPVHVINDAEAGCALFA